MNDSTLISNLPDRSNNRGTIQKQFQENKQSFNNDINRDNEDKKISNDVNTNTYVPMNIHSSPYGFKNNIEVQQENLHRLPSRDIPNDQINYVQDECVKVNYIEGPKNMKDYIKDYKEEESERIRIHNLEKNKLSRFDRTVSELQEFVLIAIMYFISQMPIVSVIMKKYLTILGIFEIDGNLNLYGKIFKSCAFALFYYISFQAINRSFPTI